MGPMPPATTNLSPFHTGIRGRCPRCGKGKLFSGLLKLAPQCDKCELNYGFADPADGPAFFVMSITGFVAMALVFVLDGRLPIPNWLTFLGVGVIVLVASVAMLIPIKGWLVNSQYFYKAGEGVALKTIPAPVESE